MSYVVYAVIALGGALGALSRYLVSTWVYNKYGYTFPWGTFVVNMLGCLILGMVYVWGTERLVMSSNMRTFLVIGLLGGFTTFSTFSLETINILKDGQIKIALFNIIGSVVFGLLAVWVGAIIAEVLSG